MVARTRFTARQSQARDVRHDILRAKMAKVKIAIGPKHLNMDDDVYRDLLERVTGNRSLTLCLESEIDDVIRALERLGFVAINPTKPGNQRKLDDSPEGKLIRALWLQLNAMGEVRNASEAALASYVLRVGKVSALQWLSASKATLVVETLKQWAVRVFPDKLRGLWLQAHAKGKRPALTEEALQLFMVTMAAGNKSMTYENLLRCWQALKAEVDHE